MGDDPRMPRLARLLLVGSLLWWLSAPSAATGAKAAPEEEAVRRLVGDFLAAVGQDQAGMRAALAPEAALVDAESPVVAVGADAAVAVLDAGYFHDEVTRVSLGKLSVTVAAGGKRAWFVGAAKLREELKAEDYRLDVALRVSGMASVDGQGSWKIDALAFSAAVEDADLMSRYGDGDDWAEQRLVSGQAAEGPLAARLRAWLAGGSGLVDGAAAGAGVSAFGSAAREQGKGRKAALKLAKGWGKLPIEITAIASGTASGGTAGWALAQVKITVGKKRPIALPLRLLATAEQDDAGNWRWTTLHFSAASSI
jgi:hypothetical protein